MHNPRADTAGPELSEADKERFPVNIEEDPGETTNLADEHPEIVERLEQAHEDWQASLD